MRSSTAPHLTPAERQVMQCYVSGMSRERIAAQMVLSCHTVAMHLRNVKLKLGAQNMAQAGKQYGDIVRDEKRDNADTPPGSVETHSAHAAPHAPMPEKDYHKW